MGGPFFSWQTQRHSITKCRAFFFTSLSTIKSKDRIDKSWQHCTSRSEPSNMIDVCQWRRSIGLFRGRTACSAGKQVVVVLSKKRSRPTLKVGIVCFVFLAHLSFPWDPGSSPHPRPKAKTGLVGRPESLANNETVCSCFSCRIVTGNSE